MQAGKEEVKLSFLDDTIIYVENCTESAKNNLLDLICEFSMVDGYKINVKKKLDFWILAMNNQTFK